MSCLSILFSSSENCLFASWNRSPARVAPALSTRSPHSVPDPRTRTQYQIALFRTRSPARVAPLSISAPDRASFRGTGVPGVCIGAAHGGRSAAPAPVPTLAAGTSRHTPRYYRIWRSTLQ
eukprot:665019-Rhodomonas_salina.1